jgi:hypothetical protein
MSKDIVDMMTIPLKMSFNQSSNYGLMIKDMEERKMVEKFLEIPQRKIKMSILHVAYARG